MDLSLQPVRSYSKTDQLNSKRQKKTAKQRGDIPDKVRWKAAARAAGACEWCGWVNGNHDPTGRKWGFNAPILYGGGR